MNEFNIELPFSEKGKVKLCRELVAKSYPFPPLAYVHSFGCQQNVSDGERIKGVLRTVGFGFTDSLQLADLVLYNTCAVRETAEDKLFGHVGELKKLKKVNPKLIIVLCGCMFQQVHNAEKVRKSYPYVDITFGTNLIDSLPEFLFRRLTEKKRIFESTDLSEFAEGLPTVRADGLSAYVPIMQGCNNYCTYCIVPYVRGREVSRPHENILADIEQSIVAGYKDITLLGQNVNSYRGNGADTQSEHSDFAALLRKADNLEGDFWLKYMTSHPKDMSQRVIDIIATSKHISKHIHLPVQSGSNRILGLMNRKYTRERYMELIKYARKAIPNVTFSTDIIVGFPGETVEEFHDTLSLVREVEFNMLYTFIYSRRSGTVAANMEDNVPYDTKSAWLRELLAVQEDISVQQNRSFIGQTVKVLVESSTLDGSFLIAKTESGTVVKLEGADEHIGTFRHAEIVEANKTTLIGKIIK